MKPLIAFYSRRGENLVDGAVRNLRMGNTELLAAVLQRLTGADIFRIEPVEDYPKSYYRCIDQARQDLLNRRRPPLKRYPEDFEQYDVVYLGYPNYWGTMPMPVFTFLEQLDFTGKRIRPFCTHEGGGMGRSERDIRHICPTACISAGFPVQGTQVSEELSGLQAWIQER